LLSRDVISIARVDQAKRIHQPFPVNDMVALAKTGLEEEHWLADQNYRNWSAWLGLNGASLLGFFL